MARVIVAANSSWNLSNFRGGLIKELLRAGHEVLTLSPDAEGAGIDGVQLTHLTCQMQRSGRNPLSEAKLYFRFVRLLRQQNPDIYLSFTVKPNIYGCSACRLLRIPSIPNVSGLGTAFLSGAAFRRAILLLYRIAFARSHAVFFQNPDDMSLFREEGVVSSEQARLIPGSGVNLTQFTPSPLPNGLNFLMVARLLGDKGVREYVHAARVLKATFPLATFSLLGGLDDQNRTAISKFELDEWIREGSISYLGSTSDVRPYIREASAVVLPSYREGLPRSLLEAAAMARPLIGTDVAGCKEIIREGVTGLLCEAKSSDSLARALTKFASLEYESRSQMAQNARRMVEEEFDERRVSRAYLTEISRLAVSRDQSIAGSARRSKTRSTTSQD